MSSIRNILRAIGLSEPSGSADDQSHKWEKKRTYDLPGPRYNPTVTVSECARCGMAKETSNWHDPDPQYFESDERDAERITDADSIFKCVEGGAGETHSTDAKQGGGGV